MAAKNRVATLTPIKNMNRAIQFYTKKLGGRLVERAPGEMRNMWAALSLAGHDIWLITPGKREKRTLAYTTFVVNNIKSYVRALQRKGVKFEKAERMGPESRIEGSVTYESFGASAFFKDSEGNLLMIWQSSPAM